MQALRLCYNYHTRAVARGLNQLLGLLPVSTPHSGLPAFQCTNQPLDAATSSGAPWVVVGGMTATPALSALSQSASAPPRLALSQRNSENTSIRRLGMRSSAVKICCCSVLDSVNNILLGKGVPTTAGGDSGVLVGPDMVFQVDAKANSMMPTSVLYSRVPQRPRTTRSRPNSPQPEWSS
ncbi:hypothetical protein BKA70DRAFT_1398484, partial [Coprinopsis sp. MPI-PUGE-AT-0042]